MYGPNPRHPFRHQLRRNSLIRSLIVIEMSSEHLKTITSEVGNYLMAALPGPSQIIVGQEATSATKVAELYQQGCCNIILTTTISPPLPISRISLTSSLSHLTIHQRHFVLDGHYLHDHENAQQTLVAHLSASQIAQHILSHLFRPNVACFVLDEQQQVLCCHRQDVLSADEGFQIPQGGLEGPETYLQALGRELFEETHLTVYQVRAEAPQLLYYLWPITGSFGNFIGQAQKYFLVHINQAAKSQLQPSEEFDFFYWAPIDFLWAKVADFKRPVYQQAWTMLQATLQDKQ